MAQSTIQYNCSHDPDHPDHLTCIRNAEVTKSPSAKNVLKRRYEAYYHPKREQFIIHRIVDSVLTLCVIALAVFIGYILFVGPPSFRPISLFITLDEQTLTSGEVTPLTLTIKNTSNTPIKNPILTLYIPPTLSIIEPKNLNLQNSIVILPLEKELRKKEISLLHMKAVPIGNIQEKQTITGLVKGEMPDGSAAQSDFQMVTYEISDSVLEVSADMPDRIVQDNPFEGEIRISNRSSIPIDELYVDIEMPKNFIPLEKNKFNTEIPLANINAHDAISLPIKGQLSKSSGEKKITITLLLKRGGKRIIQRQAEISLTVLKNELDLSLELQDGSLSFIPGKPHTAILSWKNSSSVELTDAYIGVIAEGFGISNTSLSSNNAYHSKPYELVWTKNQLPGLKKISPGSTGSVSFILKPSEVHQSIGISNDDSLEIALHSFGAYVYQNTSYSINGNDLQLPLTTIPSIRSSLRYFTPEGDQIGRGPLPPKIGSSTLFFALFDVESSIHPIEQGTLAMTFSPDITLAKTIPPQYGEYTYNSDTNTFTWNIGNLPSHIAQPNRQTGISIELKYTPTTPPIQRRPLITSILFSGIDAVTKNSVRKELKNITEDVLEK